MRYMMTFLFCNRGPKIKINEKYWSLRIKKDNNDAKKLKKIKKIIAQELLIAEDSAWYHLKEKN